MAVFFCSLPGIGGERRPGIFPDNLFKPMVNAVVASLALVMSCNTAHYFYDRLQPFINVLMLHMPRETAKRPVQSYII